MCATFSGELVWLLINMCVFVIFLPSHLTTGKIYIYIYTVVLIGLIYMDKKGMPVIFHSLDIASGILLSPLLKLARTTYVGDINGYITKKSNPRFDNLFCHPSTPWFTYALSQKKLSLLRWQRTIGQLQMEEASGILIGHSQCPVHIFLREGIYLYKNKGIRELLLLTLH